jgi:hypothetical protein
MDRTPIADLDADGSPETVALAHELLCAADVDFNPMMKAKVREDGYAGVTAFDFFQDSDLEIVFADNECLRVFSRTGEVLWVSPRRSVTQSDYPVIVDVDADGAAEMLIVSNSGYAEDGSPGVRQQPALRVFRAPNDDWAPARPIYNQHSFHGTNVRDDGTIPSPEPPHFQHHNSFRVMD